MTEPSYILHERAREYHWQGQAQLSIKAFFSGRAIYTLGNGYCSVDDNAYLLVNHNQPYAITIEADTPVESFCLFFELGFADEVYRSLTTQTEGLLANPVGSDMASLHFFERTYQHDDLLSPALLHLHTVIAHTKYENTWLYEQFNEVMQRLLQVHFNVYKEVEALPVARMTTREELYRRLYRARDYMEAAFDTPVTLDELARVASLSPTHFLRMFKQLFHQTPHQYLINKRLERAKQLLLQTDRSVTDICFTLGFESPGSFSWLFRQRVGCSPTAYRSQKGDF